MVIGFFNRSAMIQPHQVRIASENPLRYWVEQLWPYAFIAISVTGLTYIALAAIH